eukprot:gnl/TRDRNA2_/TRDRNA2_122618_c0_seq1.p1 gnl/TRDRNA2_/TRDRNA2_122618_c0~~gnl/TRDRNA2_/TRDRNA2_122618_c0_seq1.p1  ORF type:complete len:185 (-),score=35.33 gnl/TRDRNA2_/TRDRNA2_122618_c0_seq1:284-838(-)
MNLVTAIIVQSSIDATQDDREAQKSWEAQKLKSLMPTIKQLFHTLDLDDSGELHLNEMLDAPEALLQELQLITRMEDIEGLFRLMDHDGSGFLSIDEFCDGIVRTQSDKPPELIRLMKQCNDILAIVRSMNDWMQDMEKKVLKIETGETAASSLVERLDATHGEESAEKSSHQIAITERSSVLH